MFKIPHFQAWVKAGILAIPTFMGMLTIPIVLFWVDIFAILFLILYAKDVTVIVGFLIFEGITWLIFSIIMYSLIIGIYCFLIYRLWDSPPKWLSPPKKIRNKLFHMIINLLATFPIALISAYYIISIGSVENLLIYSNSNFSNKVVDLLLHISLKYSWLWFISAAYLYQWGEILQRKLNR